MSEFEQPLAATHTTAGHTRNVTGLEQVLSLIGGGLLLGNGLRQGGIGGWTQMLLGGLLAARGISQHCPLKESLTPSPWEQQLRREYGWHNLEACMRSVTVGKPRSEVFDFLRDHEARRGAGARAASRTDRPQSFSLERRGAAGQTVAVVRPSRASAG